MRKKAVIGIIIIYIITLIFSGTPAYATSESSTADQSGGGFSFEVVRPDNQRDTTAGYFDLSMEPGQQQTVLINLSNDSSKPITVAVGLYGGKTNSGGVIEYSDTDIPNDASLAYDFADIVTAPGEVEIPANSMVPLEINISMPDASFEGFIAGGIRLQDITDEGTASSDQQGMILNKFAYMTGMLLSTGNTDGIEQNMQYNQTYPGLDNYQNAIFVSYSNTAPIFVNGMSTEVQIMTVDSDEVLYDARKTNMRMAPNTLINFPVSLNSQEMVPGDYRAHVVVTTEDGGRWEWTEPFTITEEQASEFNESDLSLVQQSGVNWRLIAMIVAGVVIVAAIIFVIVRMVNKKKRTAQKNRRKKKKK
ncbi:WxL protein host-binding domain-containing protein [Enterococcus sp. LJL90]